MKLLLMAIAAVFLCQHTAYAETNALQQAVNGDHRTDAFKQRDQYRHPVETLAFFGIEPDHTVVEVWPGAGWYTEVLAPYLQEDGELYLAHFPESSDVEYFTRSRNAFLKKLADNPDVYSNVVVTEFGPGVGAPIAPPRTADRVLTFRNVHNWLDQGFAQDAFSAFYVALKPGGILGVVEHRAKPGTSVAEMKETGYVTEAYVVDLAKRAGFELLASSEINANPEDAADHPAGVWTLPPTLKLGDKDREKYLNIGESDRMTLKFRKP
jgi:predicted methyltransferase